MDTPYTILVADDHPLFREAITRVIASGFANSTLHETEDLESTLALARDNDALDLVLLDLNMPGMNGLGGLIELRNELPALPVVIISAEEDKQIILQAVTYGAMGFITKSSPRDKMLSAITQVLDGNIYLPSDIMCGNSTPKRMTQEVSITPDQIETLTRKQLQVLEHMTHGESNKMIAYHLNIAETTVKAHVSAILRKLGVNNRVQAILSANDIDFSRYLRR
jgi:DNA-binding NarL/FixJ family response regulator